MSRPAKRTATSDLNRDNWDEDDEPEEMGTFKPVGQEEMSKRTIKVAKRRLTKNSDGQKPLFSNFSGFGSQTFKPADIKTSFSFLSNLNGSDSNKTQNNSTTTLTDSTIKNSESITENPKSDGNDYLNGLKSLNECLVDWINQCVKKNPSCILTPVFRDYEKHLETLNNKNDSKTSETSESSKHSSPLFLFGPSSNDTTNNKESSDIPKISTTNKKDSSDIPKISITNDKESSDVPKISTINSKETSDVPKIPTINKGFSFGCPPNKDLSSNWLSASPVSKTNVFTNIASIPASSSTPTFSFSRASENSEPSNKEEGEAENKDDEEVPANDFKPVTEDNALFSQRVKLFIQKDKQYKDCGVGMFYIKEAEDGKGSKVHQGLVRADTSLGNIIFNVRLSGDIPAKRLGKNNVMMVCIPTPDSKPPPVPILLRVKTSEEADKLLEEINKYK